MIKSKRITIMNDWFSGNRVFIDDFSDFYLQQDEYVFVLLGLIAFICLALFIVLSIPVWLKNKKKSNSNNDSVWEYNEFINEGLSKKQFIKNFQTNEPSFCLGYISKKDGYIVNKKNDVHACVLGISGSGKSEKVIIPNIYYNALLEDKNKPCFLITDPKKDILARTGNILKSNGYDVLVFDLANSHKSLCWNPLQQPWDILHTKTTLSKIDYAEAFLGVDEVVNALPFSKSGGGSDIWVSNAKNLLNNMIKFLLLYSLVDKTFDLKYFTLANINSTLNYEYIAKGTLLNILEKYESQNEYWNDISNGLKQFVEMPKETLGGFLSNIGNAINYFIADVHLKTITSTTSINMYDLFKNNRPFAIFLCYEDHKESSQLLIPIFLSQLYKAAIDYANQLETKKLQRPLQFILEEFASLPIIKNFWNWLSISRSRRIFFMVVLQDYEQLTKYNSNGGEADIIKSQFGLTYFLETNNEKTLESIVRVLGKHEIQKISKTSNDKSTSTTTSDSIVDVMSLSELKFKDSDMMIVIAQKTKPIAIKPTPAYLYLKNEKLYDYEPYEVIEEDAKKVWNFNLMCEVDLKQHNSNETNNESNNEIKNRLELYKQTIIDLDLKCLVYVDLINKNNKNNESKEDINNEWFDF